MWVFDGEEWMQEGSVENSKKLEIAPRCEGFVPDLQVIEQLPSTVMRNNNIPPFPLP